MLLLVVSHEVTQTLQGTGEGLRIGQEHQAEVVRVLPVERAAVAEENLLALQQIQGELLVVGNVEALNINLGNRYSAPSALVQLMPSISLSILCARVRCSYRRPPGTISSLMDW